MGLQINKELNRTDGLTIPSGNVISWTTCFMAGSNNIEFRPLFIFLNVQDRDDYWNGDENAPNPSVSSNIKDMLPTYLKVMTDVEKASLESEAGAFSKVESWLKEEIVANSNGYLTDSDIVIIA